MFTIWLIFLESFESSVEPETWGEQLLPSVGHKIKHFAEVGFVHVTCSNNQRIDSELCDIIILHTFLCLCVHPNPKDFHFPITVFNQNKQNSK